jgi:hypothetical protein
MRTLLVALLVAQRQDSAPAAIVDAGVRCAPARVAGASVNATTVCLQQLFDHAAPGDEIQLPFIGEANWVVSRPLFIRRNGITLKLQPGAVLEAQRGGFHGPGDTLLTVGPPPGPGGSTPAGAIRGVTIRGAPGAALLMHREDYADPSKYTKAEWRHTLQLVNARDVLIDGPLSLQRSGGDGIYVDGVVNATVRNVEMAYNYRQGMSVIKADGLLVEGCLMRDTNGTNPQAGVDIEPNRADDDIVGVKFSNCVMQNNTGNGFDIFLTCLKYPVCGQSAQIASTDRTQATHRQAHGLRPPWVSSLADEALPATSRPISIVLEDIRSVNGLADPGTQSGLMTTGVYSPGSIVVERFHAIDVGGAGITVGKAAEVGAATLVFKDSVVDQSNRAMRSWSGVQLAPVFITAMGQPNVSAFGEFTLDNLQVIVGQNKSWLTTVGPGRVEHVSGDVTVTSALGCPLRAPSFGTAPVGVTVTEACVPAV